MVAPIQGRMLGPPSLQHAEDGQRQAPFRGVGTSSFVLAQAPKEATPEGFRPLTSVNADQLKSPRRRCYLLVGNPTKADIQDFAERLRKRLGHRGTLYFLDTRDAEALLTLKKKLDLPIALEEAGDNRFRIQIPQVLLVLRSYRRAYDDPFALVGGKRRPTTAPKPPAKPKAPAGRKAMTAIPGVTTLTSKNVDALVVQSKTPVIVIAGTEKSERTREAAQAVLTQVNPTKTHVVLVDLSKRAVGSALLRKLGITLAIKSVGGTTVQPIPQLFRYHAGEVTKAEGFSLAQTDNRITFSAEPASEGRESEAPPGIIEIESAEAAKHILMAKLPVRLVIGSSKNSSFRLARRLLQRAEGVGSAYLVAFLDTNARGAGDHLMTLGLARQVFGGKTQAFEFVHGRFRPITITHRGRTIVGPKKDSGHGTFGAPAPYRDTMSPKEEQQPMKKTHSIDL